MPILLILLSLCSFSIAYRGLPSARHFHPLKATSLDPLSFQNTLQQNKVNIQRIPTTILQLNIGLYCNQACSHCHVDSSPYRTEMMSHTIASKCIDILDSSPSIDTLDLTGGAPELCTEFRWLVQQARQRNKKVIDRCNLTVLLEPGQEDLADFLAHHQVHIIASLPCYAEKNVNQQRGSGVFDKSILALQRLNTLGYGTGASPLQLDLVYNPNGAFLPPSQASLERDYKLRLKQDFNIEFNNLFTITNMPIQRFAESLYRKGELDKYMEVLRGAFNPTTTASVMCRDTLSVGWDGRLFDCDFNQQMGLGLGTAGGDGVKTVFDITSVDDLQRTDILVGNHCFGCTAGSGSSCQGALL